MNLYVAVALLVVAPCCLGEGQSCHDQAGCASDECCVYFAPFRGRRADLGVCRKRGTLNHKCFTENRFQTEGRYADLCPCASGFGCLSMGFVEVPFGEVGQCRPHTLDVRRERVCNTGADCPDEQCCMNLNQLEGRRQILNQGICQPMGTEGSSCHVRYHAGKPKDMVYSCPCSQGLHCKGSGLIDIPLGETGTCTANTKGRREEVESRETHCSTGADCPPDQCCESLFKPIGRRQVISRAQGVCRPMGTVGSHCYANSVSGKPDHMAISCPCSTGLHCKGSGFFEMPLGEVGQCQPNADDVRRALHCNTGADCPDDHCCQSLYLPDGRRQILNQGICQPMGTAGSSCHVRYQAGKPKDMVFSCPCSHGLHCKGSGLIDIPLGETGTCTANTKGRREEVESRETHCSTGADCPPDQCCESLFKVIGRRQVISRAQGVCRPMGTVGSQCYANTVSGKPDHMAMSCPCSTGLHCKGSGFFEVPLGEVGTCQAAATTSRALQSRDTHCTSGADCPADQCCVHEYNSHVTGQLSEGVCRPLGHENSPCFSKVTPGKHDGIETLACPCSVGLHCWPHLMGAIDLPHIGRSGHCIVNKQAREEENDDVSCQTGADCPSDQCCVDLIRPKGRRQLGNMKVCRPMGTAGSSCFAHSKSGKPDNAVYACPCSVGFHCEPNGMFDMPLGELGTCTPTTMGKRGEVESRETHCSTGADCPPDQCCESLFKPIGRRQVISRAQGVCRPMGTVGSHCYANSVSGKPDHMAMSCPCSTGLHCQGSGLFEVPLGEVGQCVVTKQAREEVDDDVSCQTGADCPNDQCCVSLIRPLGRRQLWNSKVCRPMGTAGSSCFANSKPGKPDNAVYACPCSMGFHCEPNGMFDIPLGALGQCQANADDVERPVGCNTGADCPDDHCCRSLYQPGGRRQIFTHGVCEPMATAGSSCYVRYQAGKPKDMVYSCPCSQGLHCQGNGNFDMQLGENGVCVVNKQAREEESDDVSCQTGADCPSDHCCVDLNRPIGRRQLRNSKVCRPMGTAGSSCFAKSKPGKPDNAVFACPCSTGFHCKPNGIFDVPLGELGNCVADSH